MNISLYDFRNLPSQTQSEIVIEQGRLLNEKVMSSFKYVLYEISSFSVEVIYKNTDGKIVGLNIFQNTSAYAT
ncbi:MULTISPECIES: hypothetical protein [Chryseobacterium]|jgi:hypothetical protein|uniref:Uncharacterized protein n=1 Tax=Chryseobacterium indoltheticum TaxID=254 RepID=A0A381FDD5_9FLAO|nr:MULTISPECIES: hypothetical protein [Chryseobacterium]MDQ8143377.1 hypothetical protein [Chryseobacterium sp. CFS15]QQQ29223.1 hypothetical protein JJL46_04225 [Chryseobacterium indoltheticum]SUX44112.1 Uncharacterised protein [Chryseobacterium indoltheticum]